jgi:hypothetical protein
MQAAAEMVGHDLPAKYKKMTSWDRQGGKNG